MPTRPNELTRILAEIDGLLAEAEEIAEDPQDDDRDRALELVIEFQETKRSVEAKLRGGWDSASCESRGRLCALSR
jgi:hypothetical protein